MENYGSPQPNNADNAAETPTAATAPLVKATSEAMMISESAAAPTETPAAVAPDAAAPIPEEPTDSSAASDDDTDTPETTAAANDYEAAAAATVVSHLSNEAEPRNRAAEEAAHEEHVSNHSLFKEINAYTHQLQRIIMLCRRKIMANYQAHTTVVGLDAALACMPSHTTSIVNTMVDIYKSLIVNVPNIHELFDIESTREDLFRYYNLEHILATRCRRRSRRLASKRRQYQSSS